AAQGTQDDERSEGGRLDDRRDVENAVEEPVGAIGDDRREKHGADIDADQDPQDGAQVAGVRQHGQVGAIRLATTRLELPGIDSGWRWRHSSFRRPPNSSSHGRYNPTDTPEVHFSS